MVKKSAKQWQLSRRASPPNTEENVVAPVVPVDSQLPGLAKATRGRCRPTGQSELTQSGDDADDDVTSTLSTLDVDDHRRRSDATVTSVGC